MSCLTTDTYSWDEENEICRIDTATLDPDGNTVSTETTNPFPAICCQEGVNQDDDVLLMACMTEDDYFWDEENEECTLDTATLDPQGETVHVVTTKPDASVCC